MELGWRGSGGNVSPITLQLWGFLIGTFIPRKQLLMCKALSGKSNEHVFMKDLYVESVQGKIHLR